MKFKLGVMRAALWAAASLLLLASCGGGTQVTTFVPRRVIVFGDESSVINTDASLGQVGAKYTVNSLALDVNGVATSNVDCTANQIWVQQLAYSYGFSFPSCPSGGDPVGRIFAVPGATAASLSTQIDTFVGTDALGTEDFVTVMAGSNDIIAAFENAANQDPHAVVKQAGTDVGAQVVRLANAGAKVLIATVPDLSFTPYANVLEQSNPGSIGLLHTLSTEFNTALRLELLNVPNGGRSVGLVLADVLVQGMVTNPATYGLADTSQAACLGSSPLPNCYGNATPSNLDSRYSSDWLWADSTHLGITGQARLGALAVTRARGNPF